MLEALSPAVACIPATPPLTETAPPQGHLPPPQPPVPAQDTLQVGRPSPLMPPAEGHPGVARPAGAVLPLLVLFKEEDEEYAAAAAREGWEPVFVPLLRAESVASPVIEEVRGLRRRGGGGQGALMALC